MSCNILCTICARGGSKGIKNKNIRFLLGKPLIAHTIKQAFKWGKAKKVIVSTDSKKISEVALRYGAEVPFMRSKKLASDSAAKILSIRHALVECERVYRERYDIVVDLDVSSPVRTVKDIDGCFEVFRKKKADTAFSVVHAHRNPYFNMVEKRKDGFVKICKRPPRLILRRQRTPEVYNMNASIYFYKREFLLDRRNKTPFSNKTAVYVMDDSAGYDIDREIDFKFIELLMKEGNYEIR